MMLRIGNRNFDWWTFGLRSIEHRHGVVALAARHDDHDIEVVDAVATNDMNETAQRYLDEGRFRQERPGVVTGVLTLEAGRAASEIADTLMRSRRLWAEETDGSPRRESMSWQDLAELAHQSAMGALGYGK